MSFNGLLTANSMQIDALCQLMIEKGIIAPDKFFDKLKDVQSEYQGKAAK